MTGTSSLDDLWRSDNPRWGTVRDVVVRGSYAAVLDDLNSDGREVELRVFERSGDGWRIVLHQDDVSGVDGAIDAVGGWSVSIHPDSVGTFCHLGRAEPRSRVRVSFGPIEEELRVGDDGWWLWARPMDPEEAERVYHFDPTDSSLWPQLRLEYLS